MRHSRMRPQKRQVAVLGRVHTKPRAEHIGVCAVARGIHRSFRSAIRLGTEGARSAGVESADRNQSRLASLAKLAGSAQRVAGSVQRVAGSARR
jgi:hypothetical protein